MWMLDRVLVFNTSDTPTAVALLNNITIAALDGTHGTALIPRLACSSAIVHSLLLAHNDNEFHLSEMP